MRLIRGPAWLREGHPPELWTHDAPGACIGSRGVVFRIGRTQASVAMSMTKR
ncbi:hypothetical protein FHS01_005699 [Longimicrobium terrae]|uniref:Uncharacterized protein n=1 Tax=Longimicrobium terrae TaxID=1639882 RepID=A0A841H813_9BACT|nr:hypothetical protein [Longimicrobium terrae]MBB6073976.1 hypothetical protein [Longimicrobium terrae]